jgi:hypothetical protein
MVHKKESDGLVPLPQALQQFKSGGPGVRRQDPIIRRVTPSEIAFDCPQNFRIIIDG